MNKDELAKILNNNECFGPAIVSVIAAAIEWNERRNSTRHRFTSAEIALAESVDEFAGLAGGVLFDHFANLAAANRIRKQDW